MSKNDITAAWPINREVFYHLDYIPFINLDINFDSTQMLNEARSLLNEFVLHRENTQVKNADIGAWKSLALRSHEGDPFKTEYHTRYTSNKIGNYKNTVMMDKCPETYKFLSSITDIESCDRIRFMLLEPGAEIKVHRDSETRDVSFAVNISLNMPEGCDFWCNLNSDGSRNSFSKKIPFLDSGSTFLFNNSKYHSLKNNSPYSRIHIIFHGPIKINDEKLLQLARSQNNISSPKELLIQLMQKKCLINESLDKTPDFQKDWLIQGLSPNSLGENTKILVLKHTDEINNLNLETSLEKITRPSLFPLDYEVVDQTALDSYLAKISKEEQYSKVVICSAGLFIYNIHNFIIEILRTFGEMHSSNAIAAGHIIDDPEIALPHFHQQFLILDIEKWSEINRPMLGSFFSTSEKKISAYSRGIDIHDHYTPVYLAAGSDSPSREGKVFWGTNLILEALEANLKIINLSLPLRKTKMYAYPLDREKDQFQEVESLIKNLDIKASENVYFLNNEDLRIPILSNLNPTKFISVASGLKPFKILEDYNFSENSKIVFMDFSSNALNYIKSITAARDIEDLSQRIEKFVRVINPQLFSHSLITEKCRILVDNFFEKNFDQLHKRLNQCSQAEFIRLNIIDQSEGLIEQVESNEHFIIWVSNVFYNTHAYHKYGIEAVHKLYNDLAISISKKLGTKVFRETSTQNIIFGSDVKNPVGFLTDGANISISTQLRDWYELY